MDKYIKQLLEEFAKIILPGFGAIVIADENSGELMFNAYLNYDDGKLAELIEKESSKDAQEAKNAVAKFVRELQHQLDKGETYEIFQLGVFSKNEDGEYVFEGNLMKGAPEVKKTPEKKSEPKKVEPKREEKTDVAPTPELPSQKDDEKSLKPDKSTEKEAAKKKKTEERERKKAAKEAEKKEKEAKKKAEKERKLKEKQKAEEAKATKKTSDKKVAVTSKDEKDNSEKTTPAKKENVYVAPGTETSKTSLKESQKEEVKAKKSPQKDKTGVKSTKNESEEKKKRSPLFWLLLFIIAIVLAFVIYCAFNYNKVAEYMGWNKFEKTEQQDARLSSSEKSKPALSSTKTTTPEQNADTIASKPDSTEATVPKPKTETKPAPAKKTKQEKSPSTINGLNYHIIVGCFGEISNANKLVQSLQNEGYSDARIIGKLGSLNEVAVGSYASRQEAQNALNKLRKNHSGAWIDKR